MKRAKEDELLNWFSRVRYDRVPSLSTKKWAFEFSVRKKLYARPFTKQGARVHNRDCASPEAGELASQLKDVIHWVDDEPVLRALATTSRDFENYQWQNFPALKAIHELKPDSRDPVEAAMRKVSTLYTIDWTLPDESLEAEFKKLLAKHRAIPSKDIKPLQHEPIREDGKIVQITPNNYLFRWSTCGLLQLLDLEQWAAHKQKHLSSSVIARVLFGSSTPSEVARDASKVRQTGRDHLKKINEYIQMLEAQEAGAWIRCDPKAVDGRAKTDLQETPKSRTQRGTRRLSLTDKGARVITKDNQ